MANPLAQWSSGFIEFARAQSTPAIIYDLPKLQRTAAYLLGLCSPFRSECHFAVKANRSPIILKQFATCGFGVDVASLQEVEVARAVGHSRIVATSPGLDVPTIGLISELGGTVFFDGIEQARAASAAGYNLVNHGVRVSMQGCYHRFGLTPQEIESLWKDMGWAPRKFHFHYGEIETLYDLAKLLEQVARILDSFEADVIDLGGGYGVLSNNQEMLKNGFSMIADFAASRRVCVAFEFGKVAIARCALLLTSVLSRKLRGDSQLLFVDASAYNLGTLERRSLLKWKGDGSDDILTTVAGPTCYEHDIFVEEIPAPPIIVGETIAFGLCGAYSTSVASSLHGLQVPREVYFGL
ncbi:hypothetical protein ACJEBH_15260 [Pseudomonas guariconensis]|uniref:hypothetical protein n=1 Tax=Pseudomonas guariconensis TaxID=1288410 RepID=UPI0038723367